jgi:hypothetical protein
MERELSDNQYKQKITKVLLQLLEKKNYSELLEMCDEFEVDFPVNIKFFFLYFLFFPIFFVV